MDNRHEDIETFKQALWEFLLEHSEILASGKMFIKFHTDGRSDFERRIRARWKYGYHREDVRAKEDRHDRAVFEYQEGQKEKHIRWRKEKRERITRERRWGWLRRVGIKWPPAPTALPHSPAGQNSGELGHIQAEEREGSGRTQDGVTADNLKKEL